MGTNVINKLNNSGFFVMIGLIVLGMFIFSSVKVFKSYDRVISVKGLSELEVPANKVIWPVAYKEIGNDLTSIYKTISEKNKIIIQFLKLKGLTDNEISISAPEIVDMSAERYQSQVSQYRYNITSVITVTSDKIDLVRQIIVQQSDLLQKGIALSGGDYKYLTQFFYTGLNDIKPKMIEEATKNARAAAEKFAKDSDSKLGKIKNANQGLFTITDRDGNTPHIKTIRVVSTVDYLLKD